MEILQTIWTALTTENEVLSNILIYCLGFLEAFITMLIFTSLFNMDTTKYSKVLYAIVFTAFSILTSIFIPNPYNTFVNIFICPILIMLFFRTRIFTAILAEIVSYIIFVLLGAIIHNLFILIFNVTTDTLMLIPIYRTISSLCIYLSAYIVYRLIRHFKISIYSLSLIRDNKTLLINFVIGILAIAVQSYISFFYSDSLPFIIAIFNVSTLLFYFVISFYSLIRTNKLEVTERDLEQSKQYINTLTILHDNIRCFKHDFGNMVTTIGRLYTFK